jgi:DNA invertase Pin-like site-specific DNA recombinase
MPGLVQPIRTAKCNFGNWREYVGRRGWEDASEYVDAGISGSKASRPALDRLMATAARRELDCVVVYKIDRFGRSVFNLSQQLAALTSTACASSP